MKQLGLALMLVWAFGMRGELPSYPGVSMSSVVSGFATEEACNSFRANMLRLLEDEGVVFTPCLQTKGSEL